MSEFLGEARVVIRPDTTRFRAELVAQLAAATKGVTVPVTVTGLTGGTAATAGFSRLSQVQSEARRVTEQTTAVLEEQNKVLGRSTQRIGQFEKGAVASLAALTGLRGAVLAASGPFLAAAVASTAFIKSLQEFAALEQELNVFSATTEATGEQMKAVSDLAKELGADLSLPAVSASDAASALTELAKAGLSIEDAMAGARGVLQLSTAAGISTGEAAQFAANELNAFALAGDQAVRVADVLANAANSAQGSISDFGLAFKQSAAVANQVGLSLEATAAQLSIMARAGLSGSDAGTSLRVALLRLINPTKAAATIIKQLGIDLRDAQGNIRPDVFVQFAEAMRGMTPAARDAAAATVFGADGIRTMAVSAQAGREGLLDATIAIGEQGTAAELAEARTAGFGGQLEALQSTASTTAVSLGEISTIVAGPLVIGLTGIAAILNRVLEPMADLVRLSKEVLGLGGTFDPATQSAADYLIRLQQVRDAYQDLADTGVVSAQDNINTATQEAITALESQRATLKALGQDTTGVTAIIQALQNQLTAAGAAAISAQTPLEKTAQNLQELIKVARAEGFDTSGLERALANINRQFRDLALEGNVNRLRDDFLNLGQSARDGAGGVDALTSALSRLRGESTTLSDQLQKAQAEGASPQTQIAILQESNRTQEALIAQAEQGGRTAGDISTIRKARAAIISNNAQIASLQAGIQSDVESAARDAKARGDKIAQAQEDATRSFIEAFDPGEQKILNQIAGAALTERLSDDIKFQQNLVVFLRKQITLIQDRIRRLGLQGDALKVARDAIAALNKQIDGILIDIAKDQQAAQKRTQDILNQKLDFRIQIAQAQDNTAAEIRARKAKLAAITKELIAAKKEFGKNSVQWLELKAAQAEQIAAIKELNEQNKTEGKDGRKAAAEFFFSQLQAQQGFASNLLGNLISGPTAGLVGVPSPNNEIVQKNALNESKAAGGPSAGQANTTNALLERILEQLKNLNGANATPEAGHQRKVGHGSMDNAPM